MDYKRNKIYAVVEGHGEAGNRKGSSSIINLINRIIHERHEWRYLFAVSPVWRMKSQGDFFKPEKLENVLRRYKERDDCAAIVVLVDVDEDCAKEKAYQIVRRIHNMETLPFSVAVVCPKPEFEAWFLACLEDILPGLKFEDDPEEKRDAKGYLKQNYGYKPTRHQATFTQMINIQTASERSRSFRRLLHAIEELIQARERNETVITPTTNG
ncbi:MAG: DUF4276 family protein [Candidatus Promineifilaceae bacterium]